MNGIKILSLIGLAAFAVACGGGGAGDDDQQERARDAWDEIVWDEDDWQ